MQIMEIEARFRRRAKCGEDVSELNEQILVHFSEISGFWRETGLIKDLWLDKGSGESAAIDLTPCLCDGIRGAISYASRIPGSLFDKAVADDVLTLQLNVDENKYNWIRCELFLKLLKIFKPYRAVVVSDLDQDLDDFEDIVQEAQRTGKDVDGRETVFKLQPINYFDNTLCIRAFGMNAEQVVVELGNKVPHVELFEDGVLLECFEDSTADTLLTLRGKTI